MRQDFNCFGGFGQQGYGYNVQHLLEEIRNILALDRAYPAIVVGAGRIGTALANFDGFGRDNIQIQALFDIKPELVGQTIHGKPVLHMDALETYIRDNGIRIGIIAARRSTARTSQTGCRPPGSKGSGILRRWM